MPKPNKSWTLPKIKAYVREHGLARKNSKVCIHMGMSKAMMIPMLKALGHWEGEVPEPRKSAPKKPAPKKPAPAKKPAPKKKPDTPRGPRTAEMGTQTMWDAEIINPTMVQGVEVQNPFDTLQGAWEQAQNPFNSPAMNSGWADAQAISGVGGRLAPKLPRTPQLQRVLRGRSAMLRADVETRARQNYNRQIAPYEEQRRARL